MHEGKPSTARFSADTFGETDFAKMDAHVIQPEDYEDAPELTDAMMARADVHVVGVLVSRGQPDGPDAGEADAFRLPPAIGAHFRASGPGWQARVSAILLDAIEREKRAG